MKKISNLKIVNPFIIIFFRMVKIPLFLKYKSTNYAFIFSNTGPELRNGWHVFL